MGVEKAIRMPDDVIIHIIETYTCEPGVRKLKQILFEIIGEINLSMLKNKNIVSHPTELTITDVDKKYLCDRKEYKPKKVHQTNSVGLITGLWANSMGQGGILPIEVSLYPCASFLNLKLTGMQGDVMKESMTVAKTLAWSLMTSTNMDKLQKKMARTKHQGIHIHVPEGATPKDGPSAGTAITTTIYSLFTGKKIRADVAITGEICLQGKITAIGGLDLKIAGGIRAGVKEFIFPKENMDDYEEFIKHPHNKKLSKGITFTPLETIQEVLNIVFEE
jgi:ATP-dependent Lon protease